MIQATQSSTLHVCQVARHASDLIGHRVRVEGYVLDLGSHGFVLVGRRRECTAGQLGLWTADVGNSPTWRTAFSTSVGPKRAILVGIVRWEQAHFGTGHKPALRLERVEYLSQRDADLKDF